MPGGVRLFPTAPRIKLSPLHATTLPFTFGPIMRLALLLPALAALASTACAGNPVRSYTAPAPANALDCALRITAGLGYTPVAGGVNDGFIRLARTTDRNIGGAIASVMVPGRSNPAKEDHITVTNAGTALRITLVGLDSDTKQTKPSDQADGHVQAIISGCANPGTSMP